MVWLSAIGCGVAPSTLYAYPSGSGVPPEVLVVTARLPVGGGGVGQLTVKLAVTVCPAVTVTVRDVPPLTVQFPARPDNTTTSLPVATPVSATAWLSAIGCGVAPSTPSRRSSGLGVPPEVLVVTARLPVGGGGVGQLTVKLAVTVCPAVTVTVRDVPPLTVQF